MASQVTDHDVYALERKAQAGGAFYVRVRRDALGDDLRLEIIGDTDTMRVVRTVTFRSVRRFEQLPFEEGEAAPEYTSLLFLAQYPQGDGFRYSILLKDSEILFYSKAEPQVTEATPLHKPET